MTVFILRKILYAFLVLLGVLTVTFSMNFLLPGDPAALMLGDRADEASVRSIRHQLGLDRPAAVQYGLFLGRVAQGDLGRSFSTNRDVLDTIREYFPKTALLAVSAMLFATVLGILLGVAASLRPFTLFDTSAMSFALLGISLPSFVVGILFALIFGVLLNWFEISGYIDQGWDRLVLPVLTLAIRPLSIIARVTRSSMLEVLNQDYIRTAKAKGLSGNIIVMRHALRNALNPVITTISAWFASLLAGTYFVEYIFNWPGIGTLTINAIEKLDYPMIQGTVLFTAVVFVVVNTAVDIIYSFLDPRIKLS